jgi:hypothetical protein
VFQLRIQVGSPRAGPLLAVVLLAQQTILAIACCVVLDRHFDLALSKQRATVSIIAASESEKAYSYLLQLKLSCTLGTISLIEQLAIPDEKRVFVDGGSSLTFLR